MTDTAIGGGTNTLCQPGQDYTGDGKTLNFAAGPSSQTFTIRICRDVAYELSETFTAALSNPTPGQLLGGNLGGSTAQMVITDDDNLPVLTVCNVSVNENAGTVTLRISQTVATALNTSVEWATSAGSATANVDYSQSNDVAVIPAGSTFVDITVPILDDNLDEPNETFFVTLSNPVNASIGNSDGSCGDGVAQVTIVDDEQVTVISISDVSQLEGNPSAQDPTVASTTAFNFSVTRVGDAQADQTVCFETINGDITGGSPTNPNPATGGPVPIMNVTDYTERLSSNPANCITFTQGGPSKIIVPIIVHGDPGFEFDESFTVRLLNPTNAATIGDGLGLGLIQNDDFAPVLSIVAENPGVTEGNLGFQGTPPPPGGSSYLQRFRITHNGDGSVPVSVQISIINGVLSPISQPSGTNPASGGASCQPTTINGTDYINTGFSVNGGSFTAYKSDECYLDPEWC